LGSDGHIKEPYPGRLEVWSGLCHPARYWHEHRNESGECAYLTPIQDAGLHTYLRTLEITFFKDDD
jgi:hypothetical protein